MGIQERGKAAAGLSCERPSENDEHLGGQLRFPNNESVTLAQVPPVSELRPISSIKVGTRFRRDMGDIDELAASISDVGLLLILNDTHHAQYAACMVWKGDGIPVCPQNEWKGEA